MDQERIYTDEPIPSSVPPRQRETGGAAANRPAEFPYLRERLMYENMQMPGMPPRIAALRKMFNRNLFLPAERAAAFREQALYMADYMTGEDEQYAPEMDFVRYYPVYQDMTARQLCGYFAWRSGVRRGTFADAPLSYIFVYVYEILMQIGVESAEQGYAVMQALLENYADEYPRLPAYLRKWMKDYTVYYNLDAEYRDRCFLYETRRDRIAEILADCRNQEVQDLYPAIAAASGYDLGRSVFVKAKPEVSAEIICRVYVQISDYYERHHMGSLAERRFGKPQRRGYEMFRAAVFTDPRPRDSRVYEISPMRKYTYDGGRWVLESPPEEGNPSVLDEFMRETDRQMREAYGFGHPLKVRVPKPTFQKIIADVISVYQEEEKLRSVSIDLGKLAGIREAAALTRDRLLEGGEEDFAEPVFEPAAETKPTFEPVPEPVAEPAVPQAAAPSPATPSVPAAAPSAVPADSLLTTQEAEFVRLLIDGGDWKTFLRNGHLFASVMVDAINEKLYDEVGDTVLETDGDNPLIVEDYIDELRQAAGIRG